MHWLPFYAKICVYVCMCVSPSSPWPRRGSCSPMYTPTQLAWELPVSGGSTDVCCCLRLYMGPNDPNAGSHTEPLSMTSDGEHRRERATCLQEGLFLQSPVSSLTWCSRVQIGSSVTTRSPQQDTLSRNLSQSPHTPFLAAVEGSTCWKSLKACRQRHLNCVFSGSCWSIKILSKVFLIFPHAK